MNRPAFLKYLDRRRVFRIFFGALTAAWCVTIFMLSAQPGSESSETSGSFINMFCELIVPEFSGFDGAERAEFVEKLQFIVRKCAHFTAYLLLAVFSLQFFRTFDRLKKPLAAGAAAFGFSVIYAASDETHQLFVAGRSAQVRDVLIDSCGALFGVAVSLGIWGLFRKLRKKKHKEQ